MPSPPGLNTFPMRITTWNINGIRAALRKGFHRIIDEIAPDVLLLQEVRATLDQLPAAWTQMQNWQVFWNAASRKGYSGTAVCSRWPLEAPSTGTVSNDDDEGRLIETGIQGLGLACVYIPSGSSGEHRQQIKEKWMRKFRRWLTPRTSARPYLFGGDLNIAHTERDIFHAKSNQNISGFLPHERAWMDRLLRSGWHDLTREHFGEIDGPYSWWSNRGRARELDRGWRIDYLLANAEARRLVHNVTIHREGGLYVSDHAPVSVDLNWPLQ